MSSNKENQNLSFRINEDIAYFIGVLRSDGCIYKFNNKKRNLIIMRLNLTISPKSLQMAKRFKDILLRYFNRTVNIRKVHNYNLYAIQTSINKIYPILRDWKKNKIPEEIKHSPSLFGAYLAGLIDGDGNVNIKNNKDRRLAQLIISIANKKPLIDLKNLIKKCMDCGAHIYRYNGKNCYATCFYITYKNLIFLEKFIFPYITLPYKIKKLQKYSQMIKWACRDSKFSAARNFLQHP